MNRPFDCNQDQDRLALASLLPEVGEVTFTIDRGVFLDSIEAVSQFLDSPDWLVYRWGSFLPFDAGPHKLALSLSQVVELGLQLRTLSRYEGFEVMLNGFSNANQFEDTLLEAKVACLFHSSPGVTCLRFAPSHIVRGRLKRPDFEVESVQGLICVECKRPHLYAQKKLYALQRVAKHFKTAMDQSDWPEGTRLEVEIKEPVRGDLAQLATLAVRRAIEKGTGAHAISVGPFNCYSMSRQEDFKLPSAPWHTDTMVLDEDTAAELFDPHFTQLRVADYRMDVKFERSVGSRANEALKQLPEGESCIIFIGGVSPRIAHPVCRRRLEDDAYSHVRAFGIHSDDRPLYVIRPTDVDFLRGIFGAIDPAPETPND